MLLCKLSSQTLGAENYDMTKTRVCQGLRRNLTQNLPIHCRFFIIQPFSVFVRNNSQTVKKTGKKKGTFFFSKLEINLFITVFEMENEQ